MWNRKELKKKGKTAFKKNYWPSVLVALVLSLLTAGSAYTCKDNVGDFSTNFSNYNLTPEEVIAVVSAIVIGSLVTIVVILLIKIFVINPLTVGAYRFFVCNSEDEKTSAGVLFSAFRDGRFGQIFVTMFLRDLFIALWSLLFVIPGIVKIYSYRMVPYLIADHPEMSASEIITKSRQMMNGNKWNAFVLDLSFILWDILAAITCGIVGIFFVAPYKSATNAELYNVLKD